MFYNERIGCELGSQKDVLLIIYTGHIYFVFIRDALIMSFLFCFCFFLTNVSMSTLTLYPYSSVV